MTESKWLACTDPSPMLAFLGVEASARGLRLFLIACARNVLPLDADNAMVQALAVAERFADATASRGELTRARGALKPGHPTRVIQWPLLYTSHVRSVPAWYATCEKVVRAANHGARCCAWASTRHVFEGLVAMSYPDQEFARQSHYLRDIFGNPFHLVSLNSDWLTPTVVALAEGIYEDRAFDRLPILADALQDAGCEDSDVLDHCRGPGPHVRGCWVVDSLLGKA